MNPLRDSFDDNYLSQRQPQLSFALYDTPLTLSTQENAAEVVGWTSRWGFEPRSQDLSSVWLSVTNAVSTDYH